MKKAVTAASLETTAGTSVTIFPVAVITSLLFDAIATAGALTSIRAAIILDLIAVVTLLPESPNPIAAGWRFAGVGAVVLIH